MRILHCSDVHLTHDYSPRSWPRIGWRRWLALLELHLGGRARDFARAGETLRVIVRDAERHGADHLVLSGDLTAYAVDAEFAAAREALGHLADDPRRLTVVPGNHDLFTPGARRDARFERHFGRLLACDLAPAREPAARGAPDPAAGPAPAGDPGPAPPPAPAGDPGPAPPPAHGGDPRRDYPFVRLLGDEAAVVGLCSARVPRLPGEAFGVVGGAQRRRLTALLQHPALAGRAILVVVHHAPRRRDGRPDGRLHGLLDADALLELLPGPRFAVLHGHLHERFHHPATATRPHLFGAGSSTQRGIEGYWLIDVAGGIVQGGRPCRPGAPPAGA